MRAPAIVLALPFFLACTRDPQPAPKSVEPPPPTTSVSVSVSASTSTSTSPPATARLADCLAVAQDGAGPTGAVEGTVGTGKDGLFTMRLKRPRCVVGLPGATFVSEVALVSTGFDLRPLVGARVRAHGEAIAGETDMGGPAVVVMVKEVDRLPLDEPAP